MFPAITRALSLRKTRIHKLQMAYLKTHTGQEFSEGDFRNIRYKEATREVNPNISREIMKQTPPIVVKNRIHACDGGRAGVGHPRVFINLDKPGYKTCGYCGTKYILDNEEH
ncbi:putative NADH dehydrogenase [ubiquinone] iron-sulfur protein 6, mitochondrial [Thelohanellus kitauei]|uniref:Putative NADH dehydrogenase [ubiquinone] iron-sulfur protein 6, mitochondrial n=1 Tax=Thelohanellus kitauei TaxID=669202 RepID=A0A0C2IS15_THEKT|nr:putative NADH dehydrogenase [ubiquinone] iron-sulfur protein 6, mitochondrial [Thelohanellus kitauei]